MWFLKLKHIKVAIDLSGISMARKLEVREVCEEWSVKKLERKSKLKIIILFDVLHFFTLLLLYGFINNIFFFIFTLFGGLPGLPPTNLNFCPVIGITGGQQSGLPSSNRDYRGQ